MTDRDAQPERPYVHSGRQVHLAHAPIPLSTLEVEWPSDAERALGKSAIAEIRDALKTRRPAYHLENETLNQKEQ